MQIQGVQMNVGPWTSDLEFILALGRFAALLCAVAGGALVSGIVGALALSAWRHRE
jgi:threonine dehydratase